MQPLTIYHYRMPSSKPPKVVVDLTGETKKAKRPKPSSSRLASAAAIVDLSGDPTEAIASTAAKSASSVELGDCEDKATKKKGRKKVRKSLFSFRSCSKEENSFYAKIAGQPRTKKRPGRRRGGHLYNASRVEEEDFAKELQDGCLATLGDVPKYGSETLLIVDLTFRFKKSKKGNMREQLLACADTDNLTKFVLDALTGVLYPDDNQIVDVFARKRVSGSNWDEGTTEIRIRAANLHDLK